MSTSSSVPKPVIDGLIEKLRLLQKKPLMFIKAASYTIHCSASSELKGLHFNSILWTSIRYWTPQAFEVIMFDDS